MNHIPDGAPFSTPDSSSDTDFEKIWKEAQSRWLRPTEIYDVLLNNSRFSIRREPLNLPPSGTLVLFDRKLLRNFRKDGHSWRKKKDNKTVKEAHEHLKVGSEEKIHVYYAHGEEGQSNLQRRVYWLLDKTLEHIVLVHYLEVGEGLKNYPPSRPMLGIQAESKQTFQSSTSPFVADVDSAPSSASSASHMHLNFSNIATHADEDFDKFRLDDFVSMEGTHSIHAHWLSGDFLHPQVQVGRGSNEDIRSTMDLESDIWHLNYGNMLSNHQLHVMDGRQLISEGISPTLQDSIEIQDQSSLTSPLGNNVDMESAEKGEFSSCMRWQGTGHVVENTILGPGIEGHEVLRKLDSLDRWMQKELPGDNSSPTQDSVDSCAADSPMYDESRNIAQLLQPPEILESTPVNSDIHFEIKDFSPSWGFVSENVKVIIVGKLSANACDANKLKWYCIFGDTEVPAEIIHPGVFRCDSPKINNPGNISFYICNDDRKIRSDSKCFEFRDAPAIQKNSHHADTDEINLEDLSLQIQLTRSLLENPVNSYQRLMKRLHLSDSSNSSTRLEQLNGIIGHRLLEIERSLSRPSCTTEVKESILQEFFRWKLIDQLHKEHLLSGKYWLSVDESGHTPFHLAAALGYEWVIETALAAKVSIDFRDRNGWTALHWAACYGREKMVAALLAAGAKPGAVSDPTRTFPSGCTPADLANSRGHKGLAAYLSERALISHVNMLTLGENDNDKRSAEDKGQMVMNYLRRSTSLRNSIRTREDEEIFEESVHAVGQATIASARIQAAFRDYFLKQRLYAIEEVDEYGITMDEQMAVRKIQKAYRKHSERKRKEKAALQIQNRFHVWKTRKEFVNLRRNVVKIQAFYRMHRARKQYHQILWSVGVLEKALLRWRQRRKGLRGYQAEVIESQNDDDFLKIGRKQAEDSIERAASLVDSMVKSGAAREQYKRVKENFKQAKLASDSSGGVYMEDGE